VVQDPLRALTSIAVQRCRYLAANVLSTSAGLSRHAIEFGCGSE